MVEILTNREEIVHAKRIYRDKLYDTEKAEIVWESKSKTKVLFRTKKGNYFWAGVNRGCVTRKLDSGDYITQPEVEYFEIEPLSVNELKDYLGKYYMEEYERLFGKVEEA